MMEGIEKEISDAKFDHYADSGKADNFVVTNELTVTITLNEYRNLLKKAATTEAAVNAANSDKYEREQTIKKLNEDINALKVENADLKTQLYEFQKAELDKEKSDDEG